MEDKPTKEETIFTDAKTFDEALLMENSIVYVPTTQITNEVYQFISNTKKIHL